MLKFDNLEQLQRALELEQAKQVYKEHEENEKATGPPRPPPQASKDPEEKKLENELKELRVERLRQQVERERQRVEQERRQEEARRKQRRSDNAVYLISLVFTFLSVAASVILFLVLILKF